MTKVRISAQFLNDTELMTKVIDAGYILRNKEYLPNYDWYEFDIEGPNVPENITLVDLEYDEKTDKFKCIIAIP